MKVTKVIYAESDGCTYSCEDTIVVAIDLESAVLWINDNFKQQLAESGHTDKYIESFKWHKEQFGPPFDGLFHAYFYTETVEVFEK